MSDIIVIGIAGGTGSGKTTITRKIMQHFGGDVSVIYHDNYYKAHHNMSYEERSKLNYDHPDAFDTELMVEDLKKLRRGESIQSPMYDYKIHDRSEKTVTVKPAKVVVVEGILIFQSPELCDLMDIKIYVDTDADVRILRRIIRDVRDRGRSLDNIVNHHPRRRSQSGRTRNGHRTCAGASFKIRKRIWQSFISSTAQWVRRNRLRRSSPNSTTRSSA